MLEQRASTIYYIGALADPTEAVPAVGHRILITDQGSAASIGPICFIELGDRNFPIKRLDQGGKTLAFCLLHIVVGAPFGKSGRTSTRV